MSTSSVGKRGKVGTIELMKILTVCLGNICRSPAAESVLIRELEAAGITARVTSAGTADYHIGKDAHHLTRKVGTERGYEFTSVADQLTTDHIDDVDLVLAMDESNLENILALAKTDAQRAKIIRFGAFGSTVNQDGIANVPDPYGFPEDAFIAMYDQLEDATRGLIEALQQDRLGSVLERHSTR